VTPHLTRDPSLSTGKVFVLVDGAGERTMITDRGAGETLSPEDLPEPLFREGHLAARVVEQAGGRPGIQDWVYCHLGGSRTSATAPTRIRVTVHTSSFSSLSSGSYSATRS
jgi:hypothetical protein